ncbi:MAG: flagellar hook-length control protein FliK [Alphaproteobacteria bacterium]|nr:flagellar hook-length control protein FliK [Alphaproteobacteria bacterium]
MATTIQYPTHSIEKLSSLQGLTPQQTSDISEKHNPSLKEQSFKDVMKKTPDAPPKKNEGKRSMDQNEHQKMLKNKDITESNVVKIAQKTKKTDTSQKDIEQPKAIHHDMSKTETCQTKTTPSETTREATLPINGINDAHQDVTEPTLPLPETPFIGITFPIIRIEPQSTYTANHDDPIADEHEDNHQNDRESIIQADRYTMDKNTQFQHLTMPTELFSETIVRENVPATMIPSGDHSEGLDIQKDPASSPTINNAPHAQNAKAAQVFGNLDQTTTDSIQRIDGRTGNTMMGNQPFRTEISLDVETVSSDKATSSQQDSQPPLQRSSSQPLTESSPAKGFDDNDTGDNALDIIDETSSMNDHGKSPPLKQATALTKILPSTKNESADIHFKDIHTQIAKDFRDSLSLRNASFDVHLTPEGLGTVHIQIQFDKKSVEAHFHVDSAVMSLFEQNRHQISEIFAAEGFHSNQNSLSFSLNQHNQQQQGQSFDTSHTLRNESTPSPREITYPAASTSTPNNHRVNTNGTFTLSV